MAFGKLSQWFPNIDHVDPRVSEQYTTGTKYCVVSISRHPTYASLRNNQETVADTKMLGLIQDFSAPQARPISRVYELGSRYPYSVAGKFTGDITMSSIFFDASGNMLGNIYSTVYGVDGTSRVGVGGLDINDIKIGNRLINRPVLYVEGNPINYSMKDVGGIDTGERTPGVGAIRMSIDDNAIDKPFGLVLSIFQSEKRVQSIASVTGAAGASEAMPNNNESNFKIIACLFFEMVKIQGYQFMLRADMEVISESAGFFYTGLVNVKTALESAPDSRFDRTGLETPPAIINTNNIT